MIVDLVVGARPNYMKAAALYHAWREAFPQWPPFRLRIVDTGQHYDPLMSSAIGAQLGLPQPHVFLAATGASTTELTAAILLRYGRLLQESPPAATIVVGDVTSTLAAALAARQAGIFLVHVEAGLRSGDRSMPEENNRILTDAISDLLLVTSDSARENLLREGVAPDKIELVGNTMIDTLCRQIGKAEKPRFWEEAKLEKGGYLLLTMHRPNNVDGREKFRKRIQQIAEWAAPLPVVFPVHPRIQGVADSIILPSNIIRVAPQGYHQFLFLLQHCRALLTDSGGASEEAAFLKKRCLVLRTTTERPETTTCGAAILIGEDEELLQQELNRLQQSTTFSIAPIKLWDGKAGLRALHFLQKKMNVHYLEK